MKDTCKQAISRKDIRKSQESCRSLESGDQGKRELEVFHHIVDQLINKLSSFGMRDDELCCEISWVLVHQNMTGFALTQCCRFMYGMVADFVRLLIEC